ncbi:uncharacterized protein VTP21DRAFT_10484 [Calcarisporiella thermophila]|uniref:uncharacterized protein n=1 Tax=Calcarisporiella thermophila TaxID=911321 RepID=UPI003743137A
MISGDNRVKLAAINLWKLALLQKPDSIFPVIKNKTKETAESRVIMEGFTRLLETNSSTFLQWLEDHKKETQVMLVSLSKFWEAFVTLENKNNHESLMNSRIKRRKHLKRILRRDSSLKEVLHSQLIRDRIWAKNIREMQKLHYARILQDESSREKIIKNIWEKLSTKLFRERTLWGEQIPRSVVRWKLDATEGPCRMRKRLQIDNEQPLYHNCRLEKPENSLSGQQTFSEFKTADNNELGKDVARTNAKDTIHQDKSTRSELLSPPITRDDESILSTSSNNQTLSLETTDDRAADTDEITHYEEDKNRKVLQLLDPEDSVVDVYNTNRINGLDACESLLLFCNHHLYLIDGFFKRADGDIVDVADIPNEERDQYLYLLSVSSGSPTLRQKSDIEDKHELYKWAFEDIREIHRRKFLFRNVALEIFLYNGQNFLITLDIRLRDQVYNKLINRISTPSSNLAGINSRAITSILGGSVISTKFSNIFKNITIDPLTEISQRWVRREISNFQYLVHLNTLAGRSYNDLTQYPVFPWILADYKSSELDLSNPATFRDLSKPMGAQTPEREVEFQQRYCQLARTDTGITPFHYGTHYSSAMIVCSFLIRLEPFTQHFLTLQGGHFDHADRLFHSLGLAWESASRVNMSDVRELIPEFFYLPEFLENINNIELGTRQENDEKINEVILPPWAKGDPKIFIQKHREALECDFVSENLHLWIDLIFGYKQQGQSAVEATNVFHHLSYEGAVDLEAITDPVEKVATVGIIHNFGQTPLQLFKKPHPQRQPEIRDILSLGYLKFQNHVDKLVQSIFPIKNISQQVKDIEIDNNNLLATAFQQLLVPSDTTCYLEWGNLDGSLRLLSQDGQKTLAVFENMHIDYISCACFADNSLLITGGTDSVVCFWDYKVKQNSITILECVRGHQAKVNCVVASKSFNILASGSEDKTCILWDLIQMKYIRQLSGHDMGVQAIAINNNTGDIATCSGPTIKVFTINGELLLSKTTSHSIDPILSCKFYEEQNHEWNKESILFTGHRRGFIKIWEKKIRTTDEDQETQYSCNWDLELLHQLHHEDRVHTLSEPPDITALCSSSLQRVLYTGDSLGRVFAWVLPDGSTNIQQINVSIDYCLNCGNTFPMLERKFSCRACGGIFCSTCIDTTSSHMIIGVRDGYFCHYCSSSLGPKFNDLV